MAERKSEKNNSRRVGQDINPGTKRSIRNVSLDERDEEKSGRIEHEEVVKRLIRRRELKEENTKSERVTRTRESERSDSSKKPSRKNIKSNLISFGIVFGGVAIIAVALSLLYSKAVVTITPKITNFEVDQKVTAKKIATLRELQYEIVTSTSTQSKDIVATKGPLIQSKAKGTVTLYNYSSTATQKILAGTRLSNTDGLIYRTSGTVVIPGVKSVAGKNTPGSISVGAIADLNGANYNTSGEAGSVLKIVAYKGSPKYDTIYGKIKTDFTGGYSGNKLTIDPKLQASAVTELKSFLKALLEDKIKTEVSSNYILYPKLVFIDYSLLEPTIQNTNSGGSNASITVQGVVSAVVFKSDNLFKYIAQDQVENFPSNTYKIKGLENLEVSIANSKDFSPKKGNSLILNIKGPLTMTGTFLEDSLKSDLVGKKLSQSNAIFAKYPAISNAYALITPFWLRSFPNSKEKIILNIKSD